LGAEVKPVISVISGSVQARVSVNGEISGEISQGILVLLGVGLEDGVNQVKYLVDKVVNLRIFEDERGKMNKSLLDIGGPCWQSQVQPADDASKVPPISSKDLFILPRSSSNIRKLTTLSTRYFTWLTPSSKPTPSKTKIP